ncbi:hypothetical protein SLS60_004097 [Paraconiothyrium brasiliense]|uniref:Uncharacterized protein n=1 Tax=Paraconiothyrium brasiliense TaxID=300254 RepID=A0ABR3RQJ2_9PLEO
MERKHSIASAFSARSGNIPVAFNPSTNHSPAPALSNLLKASPAQDRLIVGVDFGTTYSGALILGITSDKVPTEIAYVSPSDLSKPNIKWGFQFKPEETRLRCIKLFLDRSHKLPHFVSPLETAAQLRKYEKTVAEAVSDYLAQIYKHTMETLTRRYGETFMSMTKVQFVLTVPAVWSDSAKDATLRAAEKAGLGSGKDLKLISEPEAAAVYTLKAIQPNNLKIGDNFIVCDAGGGTVDLIAYKITQLNPLRVEESAVGTGGLCGSAFLNYRFEDHVKSRIGTERYTMMREKKVKTWNMGLKYFEEFVKRNFNEEENTEVNVPFPGLPDDEEAGLESGFLVMSTEQVKEIFDPVVQEVISLVEGQVQTIRAKGGLAPTRSAPDNSAKQRGQPSQSSNDKVTKRRGRPPGSRNSLPTTRRGPKLNAGKPVSSRKTNLPTQNQIIGAKRKRAAGDEYDGERAANKRGRPARMNDVGANEEEVDELSFTQAEAIPTAVTGHKQERTEQLGSARKRGRPSRTRNDGVLRRDTDEASAQLSKAQNYVQLAPRTRRIAREVMETWPHVSPQVLEYILETLRDAKKDIVNTQRDEQKAFAAEETLGSMIRMLARQLSGSRIPPQAKDVHFNIDKLTERYAQLFRDLTTARHSHQLLTEQVKVAQHLLQKDQESLEQLRKHARDWKMTWKQQEKHGRMHPLLKDLESNSVGDKPQDIGWKQSKVADVTMLDSPDSDLAPHLEQLERSLESMQGNHEQVGGMDVGIRNAQVALDDVLFKHASAEEYATL